MKKTQILQFIEQGNSYIDTFDEHYDNLYAGLEDAEEACPECKNKLSVVTISNAPDDIASMLVCQSCGYREIE